MPHQKQCSSMNPFIYVSKGEIEKKLQVLRVVREQQNHGIEIAIKAAEGGEDIKAKLQTLLKSRTKQDAEIEQAIKKVQQVELMKKFFLAT